MSRIQRTVDQVHRQAPLSGHALGTSRPADLRPASGPAHRPPPLALTMAQLVHDLHNKLLGKIDAAAVLARPEDARRRDLRKAADHLCDAEDVPLTRLERERAVEWVVDEILGFGPLQRLMDDTAVREILATGPGEVCASRSGSSTASAVPTGYAFRDAEHLRHVLERMAGRPLAGAGERVAFQLPAHTVEAVLPATGRAAPMLLVRRR